MTEASKARKRHPMRAISVPTTNEEERESLLRMMRMAPRAFVLPAEARMVLLSPRRSRQPRVLLSVVSCRAGVGGRRGRARRRRGVWRAPGKWILYLPQYEVIESTGQAFDLFEMTREWAEHERMRGLGVLR